MARPSWLTSNRSLLQLSSAATSSSWTTSVFTRLRACARLSRRAKQFFFTFCLIVWISIRSSSSSPNSRRSFAKRPPVRSRICGQSSPPVSRISPRLSVRHIFSTPGMVNLIVKCSNRQWGAYRALPAPAQRVRLADLLQDGAQAGALVVEPPPERALADADLGGDVAGAGAARGHQPGRGQPHLAGGRHGMPPAALELDQRV